MFRRTLAAVVLAVSGWMPISAAHSQTAKEALAMFLFGSTDPDATYVSSLAEANKEQKRVRFREIHNCKFEIDIEGGHKDVVDFGLIAEVRHFLDYSVSDKFRKVLDPKLQFPKVVWVQLLGSKEAICQTGEACVDKRVYMFGETLQLDRAKRAYQFFRANFCKGRSF